MGRTITYEFLSTKTKEEEGKTASMRKFRFKTEWIREKPTKELNLFLKMKQPDFGMNAMQLQNPQRKNCMEFDLDLQLGLPNSETNGFQSDSPLQRRKTVQQLEGPTPNPEMDLLNLQLGLPKATPNPEMDFLKLPWGLPKGQMNGKNEAEQSNLLGKLKRPSSEMNDDEQFHCTKQRRKLVEELEKPTQEDKDNLETNELEINDIQDTDFLSLQLGLPNVGMNGKNEAEQLEKPTQQSNLLGKLKQPIPEMNDDEQFHYPNQRRKLDEDADFLSLRLGPPNLEMNGLQLEAGQQREEQELPHPEEGNPVVNPFTIVKTLTISDTNHLCRLVLHHHHLCSFFQTWGPDLVRRVREGERINIIIRDVDTEYSMHRLVFRRWRSNNLFIIQSNWRASFVVRRQLKAGDKIGMLWSPQHSCFFFSVLSRA